MATVSVRTELVTPAPVVQSVGATITLDTYEARLLRTMLGDLKREERKRATLNNGGDETDANNAVELVKSLHVALQAQGFDKLDHRNPAVLDLSADDGDDLDGDE